MRSIFVIIVHFGKRAVTDKAIASLVHGSRIPDHLIVINHGSVSDAPENKGYAAGLAAGIRQAGQLGATGGDLLLLLNNDAIVTYNGIEMLLRWWDTSGGPNVLAGTSWGSVSLITGRANITDERKIKDYMHIPYIHGSCIALEYSLASKLAFPEELFMYWEDVVLSIRAERMGAELRRVSFPLVHHTDTTQLLSKEKLYYLVRNGAYVLEHEMLYVWKMYWHIMNSIRQAYHGLYRSQAHRVTRRALIDARHNQLGKVSL